MRMIPSLWMRMPWRGFFAGNIFVVDGVLDGDEAAADFFGLGVDVGVGAGDGGK